MKTELVALAEANYAAAQTTNAGAQANATVAQALRDAISALPEDPIPAPTGFRISRTYGGGDAGAVAAEFTWDIPQGQGALLECKGAPNNPNGPQEWTGCAVNMGGPGIHGELATYIVIQTTQQTILFRLRATLNGGYSEPVTLQFSTPENLPEALT